MSKSLYGDKINALRCYEERNNDPAKQVVDFSKVPKRVEPDYMFSNNIDNIKNNKFSVDISSLDIPSFCEDRGISFMINNGEIDRDYLIDKLIKYILKNENKG